MDKFNIRNILMMLLGITLVFALSSLLQDKTYLHPLQSSYLLEPISDNMILITSAGQTTDSYILQDLANDLRLNNLFMPETSSIEIEDLSAIIISVGYSEIGLSLHDKSFDDEYARIDALIKKANKQKLPIITVFLGGEERRNKKTDKLLSLVCSNSNYIITTAAGNFDDFIANIAKDNSIPISFVENIKDLSKPLASIFR